MLRLDRSSNLEGHGVVIETGSAGFGSQRFILNDTAENSSAATLPEHLHAKYWVLLVCAVLAAFGPITLIKQPFWDDWVVRAWSDNGALLALYTEMGVVEWTPLVKLFALADPRVCTVAELLLFCVLAPLIYTIIRRMTQWSPPDAFWAALLTALAPLDQARFTLVTLVYGFCCVFFALALVLMLRDLTVSSIGRRVVVVLLFVMSFSTNSFLVLAWIAPAAVAIHAWRRAGPSSSFAEQLGATIRAVISRSELVLLPLIYWLAKKIFEPTSGLYAQYNKFQFGLPEALKRTASNVIHQFDHANLLLPAYRDITELSLVAAIATALFAGAAWMWRLPLKARNEHPRDSWIANGLTLAVALALVGCAMFPYVLVGKPARFNGLWETRHQTTLMMVSGFVLYFFLRLTISPRFLWIAAASIATFFLVIDVSVTNRLVADSLEARTVANLFRNQSAPPGTMMFVLENDREYRTLGRFLAFYELSFLVNEGVPGGPRLAISNREVLDPATGTYPTRPVQAVITALTGLCEKLRLVPQYGFGGFVSNGKIETIKLIADDPPPQLFETIREAIRASSGSEPKQQLTRMVRMERETSPVGGACISPCCSDR